MNKFIFIGGLALCLSACSTTSKPEDLGELVYTGFSEKADGTAYHKATGLSCPAEIDGISRDSTHVYDEDGTDVSCNYVDGDRIFTMYLSKFPKYDLATVFQDSVAAIKYRFSGEGYAYDEALSDSCSSVTMDETALLSGLSGLLSGQNTTNEITLRPSPSAVYTKGSKMTLAVVEEMLPSEYFKVRYSGAFEDEASVEKACELARETYLSIEQGVKADRGLAITKEDQLRNLLNASDGS